MDAMWSRPTFIADANSFPGPAVGSAACSSRTVEACATAMSLRLPSAPTMNPHNSTPTTGTPGM